MSGNTGEDESSLQTGKSKEKAIAELKEKAIEELTKFGMSPLEMIELFSMDKVRSCWDVGFT